MKPIENGEVLLTTDTCGVDFGLLKYNKQRATSEIILEKGACGREFNYFNTVHGHKLYCHSPSGSKEYSFVAHDYKGMPWNYRTKPSECEGCFKAIDSALSFAKAQLPGAYVPKAIRMLEELLYQKREATFMEKMKDELRHNRIESVVDEMESMYESLYDVPGPIRK